MEFQHAAYEYGHGLLADMVGVDDHSYINHNGFGTLINNDQNQNQNQNNAFLLSSTTPSTANFDHLQGFSLPPYNNLFDPQLQPLNSSASQHFSTNVPFVDQDLIMSATTDHHHLQYHMISTPDPYIKHELMEDEEEDYNYSMLDDDVQNYFVHDDDDVSINPRVNPEMPYPQGGFSGHETGFKYNYKVGKMKGKKCKLVEGGQHSKNLMAERRRRKRVNDRLSMLRSIVPKISKTDRASILADTIDYMKELLHKINHMQQQMNVSSSCTTNKIFTTNSPKFEVERKNRGETVNVEVCCSGKPADQLVISTVSTLESLGLQIHQCVISCFFNDHFTMHASCSDQGLNLKSDDIKQALFRNAGYSGRCL